MSDVEQKLIEGLREAVETLYRCRYSEQPLAVKLDALLKQITGKSQADLMMEWVAVAADARSLGTGIAMVGPDGSVRRIDPAEVIFKPGAL